MAIWLSRDEPPREFKVYNLRKIVLCLLAIFLVLSIIGLIHSALGQKDDVLFTIRPNSAQPGNLIIFEIRDVDQRSKITGFLGNQEIKFFWHQNKYLGLGVVSLEQSLGNVLVSVEIDNSEIEKYESDITGASGLVTYLKVKPKDWPERKVSEPKPLLGEKLARWQKEKAMVKTALTTSVQNNLWSENFVKPLSEFFETSPFGEKRISPVKTRQHKGADYKANSGDNVRAINSGRVVLTGNFLADGKIVIVDHGLGLQSLYLHLSRIKVKKGQTVKQGQIIGNAGSTGFSNGPHLHLEVRLDGKPFDPMQIFDIVK